MQSPFTGGNAELVKESKELEFRNETLEIIYHSWKCVDTGELFTTDELDTLNINQVHNKYREQHNIPFPDQIRATRSKYGLSATKMSEILGFGVNTYRNYEKGEVPQASNAKLIKLAENPSEFKRLVEISDVFDKEELGTFLKKIEVLREGEEESDESYLKRLLSKKQAVPDVYSGYREMRLEKLFNMIVFFAEKQKPFKTRLNKLLFYSDFCNYQKTGFSVSGTNYVAIKLGPVPDSFDLLYDFARRKNYIHINYFEFDDNIGEQFEPDSRRAFESELFDEGELENMEFIFEYFKDTKTPDLIEKSHREKAWLENEKKNGLIEYDYAFDLELK